MKRKIAFTAALTFLSAVALAQDPFSRKESADTNVGPIGLAAKVDGKVMNVSSLVDGGPAQRAGIKPGDKITGVEGQPFAEKPEPAVAIVVACDVAEARGKKDAQITLTVNDKEVRVSFPALGKHSASCPKKCKKCDAVVRAGVDYLVSQQRAGCFPTELGGKTGKVVVTSLGGLALMAAGGPEASIAAAANYVMAHCGVDEKDGMKLGGGMGGGNWNQENWELGYGCIFLAEYARRTRSGEAKARLFEVAKKLEKNQEASGGWAHGPGGPNSLGYLELEIVSNWSLMGLGAAKRLGYPLDKAKLEKATAWIEETTHGDGGVGYSPREGQKGFGEAGRTSGAIAAYGQLGLRGDPFFARMSDFYRGHATTLTTGHVSPYMHMTSGAIASYILGPRDWAAYIETYRPELYAARRGDGSFAAIPTHESDMLHSNTDSTVGSCWTTASAVLILSLGDERVPVLIQKAGGEKGAKPEKPGKATTGVPEPTPPADPAPGGVAPPPDGPDVK